MSCCRFADRPGPAHLHGGRPARGRRAHDAPRPRRQRGALARRPRPGRRRGRSGRRPAYRTCTSAASCCWTRGRDRPGSPRWSRRGRWGGRRRSTRRRRTTSSGSARTSSWAGPDGVDLLLPNEIEAQALGGDDAMLGAAARRRGLDGRRWRAVGDAGAYVAGSGARGRRGRPDGVRRRVRRGGPRGVALRGGPEEALTRGVELGSRAAGRTGARP